MREISLLVAVGGLGLVLLALTDIFFTVLYPRSHKGVLSVPISRGLWRLFRLFTINTPRRRRDEMLSYSGPTLLVVIVFVWIALLLIGFALIIWPQLGQAIQAVAGPTPTDFATAIYYSGYALTTLGTGDHTYPILHYFRFRETYYALPRMLLLAMDTVTLIASALNADKYRSLVRSAAVAELWGGGMQLLLELSDSFLPKNIPIPKESPQAWRERYYQAVQQLQTEGIETAQDIEAGAELYISLRRQWGPLVLALAEYLGHEWSEMATADSKAANYQIRWGRGLKF